MADSVTTATIIAALIAGATGGLLAALVQMGSERSENFRTRRVEAADDFSTALAQALLELNEAHTLFVRSEFGRFYADYESGRSQLTSARRSIDVAHTYLARVELLFGDESQG